MDSWNWIKTGHKISCDSIANNCHCPFLGLLKKLNGTPGAPPVTSIMSDGVMSFTLHAAEELGILSMCSFH